MAIPKIKRRAEIISAHDQSYAILAQDAVNAAAMMRPTTNGACMSVKYPSHLYIRVDRPLRADLLAGAEAAGQTVSEFARGLIRSVVTERSDGSLVPSQQGSQRQRGGTN